MISTDIILEFVALTVVFLAALFGNVTLFYVVGTNRNLRTRGNVFILNLAAADLLVAVVNLPITMTTVLADKWILGKTVCQISGFITLLTFVASCMALSMININRYHAIMQWQSYKNTYTKRKCLLYVGITWAITIVLSIPPFFGWARFDYDPGQSYCFAEWKASKSYTIFMIAACLCGPLSIMTYCYVRINLYDKKFALGISSSPNESENTRNTDPKACFKRRKKRLTRTILTLIFVFGVCWSPFALIMIAQVFFNAHVPRYVDFGSLVLGYLNSFLNVIVYNATNRKIREKFKQALQIAICKKPRVKYRIDPSSLSTGQFV